MVEVWIDGGSNGQPQYTFSEYGSSLAFQQSWILPAALATSGPHTVVFKNPSTSYIDMDAIEIP